MTSTATAWDMHLEREHANWFDDKAALRASGELHAQLADLEGDSRQEQRVRHVLQELVTSNIRLSEAKENRLPSVTSVMDMPSCQAFLTGLGFDVHSDRSLGHFGYHEADPNFQLPLASEVNKKFRFASLALHPDKTQHWPNKDHVEWAERQYKWLSDCRDRVLDTIARGEREHRFNRDVGPRAHQSGLLEAHYECGPDLIRAIVDTYFHGVINEVAWGTQLSNILGQRFSREVFNCFVDIASQRTLAEKCISVPLDAGYFENLTNDYISAVIWCPDRRQRALDNLFSNLEEMVRLQIRLDIHLLLPIENHPLMRMEHLEQAYWHPILGDQKWNRMTKQKSYLCMPLKSVFPGKRPRCLTKRYLIIKVGPYNGHVLPNKDLLVDTSLEIDSGPILLVDCPSEVQDEVMFTIMAANLNGYLAYDGPQRSVATEFDALRVKFQLAFDGDVVTYDDMEPIMGMLTNSLSHIGGCFVCRKTLPIDPSALIVEMSNAAALDSVMKPPMPPMFSEVYLLSPKKAIVILAIGQGKEDVINRLSILQALAPNQFVKYLKFRQIDRNSGRQEIFAKPMNIEEQMKDRRKEAWQNTYAQRHFGQTGDQDVPKECLVIIVDTGSRLSMPSSKAIAFVTTLRKIVHFQLVRITGHDQRLWGTAQYEPVLTGQGRWNGMIRFTMPSIKVLKLFAVVLHGYPVMVSGDMSPIRVESKSFDYGYTHAGPSPTDAMRAAASDLLEDEWLDYKKERKVKPAPRGLPVPGPVPSVDTSSGISIDYNVWNSPPLALGPQPGLSSPDAQQAGVQQDDALHQQMNDPDSQRAQDLADELNAHMQLDHE